MADSSMHKVVAQTESLRTAERVSAVADVPAAESTAAAGVLQHLRHVTRAAHRSLEQQPLLHPLLSSSLTVGAYARVLDAFIVFFEACEPSLVDALAASPLPSGSYRYISRLPLLQEDRHDLARPSGRHLPALAVSVPFAKGDAALLGCLYVLEGATQGGRVIAPNLEKRLALHAGFGARYFHLHEQGQWRRFQALLAGCADIEAAAEQAIATFAALHHCLDQCLDSGGEAKR